MMSSKSGCGDNGSISACAACDVCTGRWVSPAAGALTVFVVVVVCVTSFSLFTSSSACERDGEKKAMQSC